MPFGSMLYRLLIGPLELFFETVFSLGYRMLGNLGLSIIFLSLAMNFLVLPLYRRADALQAEERDREAQLKPWVDHIKKTFQGDERFMMLQTFYRQKGYKQTDALKGSLSLLLEIPFFIAAYRFLSGLEILQGVSFGPIRDLGAPDGLLVLGGITLNLLPILMTAINGISAAIYLKGFPLKSKIQTYGIALIFLVFLYNSPAGLVFYWTLNNVFSLVKNIFYRFKHPGTVLKILFAVIGAAGLIVVLFIHPMATVRRQVMLILALAALMLPLPLGYLKKASGDQGSRNAPGSDKRLFLVGSLLLAVLTGLLIPSAVIQSSPDEFVNISQYQSPLWFVLVTTLYAVGTFVIWFGVFYRLAGERSQRYFEIGMLCLAWIAVVDYMFFGTHYGTLSALLVYETEPVIPLKLGLLNLAVLVGLCALLYFLWKKRAGLLRGVTAVICLALAVMSVVNCVNISQEMAATRQTVEAANTGTPKITLSKNGKNVVVIMTDRAIGAFIPFLMNEKPELLDQFAGFTFYPNTLSLGMNTLVCSPELYGGYEYTPEARNARSDMMNVDKQNESLKVMPVLFLQNDYEVTVFDPTYANYKYLSDLSIFDEYPEINRYITLGEFSTKYYDAFETRKMQYRNFFCYSLFRIAPQLLQVTAYNAGAYNELKTTTAMTQTITDISYAEGLNEEFLKTYAVLVNMPAMTEITSAETNTFLMMSNDTPHAPTLLQEPEYEPSAVVDNTEYDAEHAERVSMDGKTVRIESENAMKHYQVNMANLIQLGKWFDYLRDNGVYDNTRIILVADHGHWSLNDFASAAYGPEVYENPNVISYNPLLMVKDFDAEEFTVDESFMTNADTPTLAMEGLIDDPVNPFTGNAINSEAKNEEQHVLYSFSWKTSENDGNTLVPGDWWAVQPGDIYDVDNWSLIAEDTILP